MLVHARSSVQPLGRVAARGCYSCVERWRDPAHSASVLLATQPRVLLGLHPCASGLEDAAPCLSIPVWLHLTTDPARGVTSVVGRSNLPCTGDSV
jgi:hypothetical protein